MQLKLLLVVIFGALLVSSCATPQFTKRYDSVSPVPANLTKKNILDVSAFVAGTPPSPTVRRLSEIPEDALAEAIKAISGGSAVTSAQIGQLMSTSISPTKPSSAPNYVRFSRRIAVTVDYDPSIVSEIGEGDRLTRLSTTFSLSGNDTPKFASWSRLSSALVEVDLGDLTFKQNNKLSANAEFDTLSPDLAGLDIGGELARELVENVRLRQNILPLYGVLNGKDARLEQRGALGRDLVGIQSIDITISVAADDESRIVTTFRKPSKEGGTPTLQTSLIRPPKKCDVVYLSVDANGTLRRITSGDETTTESDDKVKLVSVEQTSGGTKLEIISRDQLRAPNWSILERGGDTVQMQVLGASGPQEMFFDSESEATSFFDFMSKQKSPPSRIGAATITVGGTPVTQSYFEKAIIAEVDRNQDCPKK